jgi:hypothetical protein
MKQYKIYLPLNYNDGKRVPQKQIDAVRDRLADRFGGTTVSPLSAPYQGPWKYGGVEYVDNIVIMEVITDGDDPAERFFRNLKEELKRELHQVAILITAEAIETI